MSRLIIRNESSQSDREALEAVIAVIGMGRISDNDRSYCYVTVFPIKNIVVAAYVTKTGSDVFYISDKERSKF